MMNNDKEVSETCDYTKDCCCAKFKPQTERYLDFLIKSGEGCKCTIIEVATVNLSFNVVDLTYDQLYGSDKLNSLRSSISTILGISDMSRVRITNVIKGSVRRNLETGVLVNLEILQSSPQDILNRSETSTVNTQQTLDSLKAKLVEKLQSGAIDMPFRVSNVSVTQTAPPSVAEISNPSSVPVVTPDPVVIEVPEKSTATTAATDESVSTLKTDSNPTFKSTIIATSSNSILITKVEEDDVVWYWYIILIGCLVVIVIVLLILYFFFCRKNKNFTEFKMVDNKSSVYEKNKEENNI